RSRAPPAPSRTMPGRRSSAWPCAPSRARCGPDPRGSPRAHWRPPTRPWRAAAVVDAAPVGGLPEAPLEPVGREVEGLVEVLGARFAADHRAAGPAGDLDVLAAAVLSWVLLVMEFDVGPNDLAVVAFEFAQLLRDVLPVVIRHHDVAASDDDL